MAISQRVPNVGDSIQYTGANAREVCEWLTGSIMSGPYVLADNVWLKQVPVPGSSPVDYVFHLVIETQDGEIEASPGQWITITAGFG
jgi:hypothetical protein